MSRPTAQDDFFAKIRDRLKPCATCGANDWRPLAHVECQPVEPPGLGIVVSGEGPLRLAPMLCPDCGHVLLFSVEAVSSTTTSK